MQRNSRLVGNGQEATYSEDHKIHQIVFKLLNQQNAQQNSLISSLLKKSKGAEQLKSVVAALRSLQQKKRDQLADSLTLGGLAGVLETCNFADPDPEIFLKTIKENQTVHNRIMNIINADPELLHQYHSSPEFKNTIDERTKFFDNQNTDIKMIEELIERINTFKAIHANQKQPKPGKIFKLFTRSDKHDHDNNGTKSNTNISGKRL